MTSIDAKEAASALSDIDSAARRVRQSTIYQLSSLFIITWGVLVVAGNLTSFVWPRSAGFSWLAVYLAGIAGSFAISAIGYSRTGIRIFDFRILIAFFLFIAFGIFTCWLGHLTTARQIGTFWAMYFMLVYTIAVLWIGLAYVAIGLSITADLDRLLLPGPLVRAVDGAGERRRTDSGRALDAPELTNG